jgi:ABC-type antimicrobial peptide transport system permease subunit
VVLRLVLSRAAALIGAGTVLGLVGAVALARVIMGLLFATAPFDPVTFVSAPLLLAAVALAASYLPASRATRVDPMVSLRCD